LLTFFTIKNVKPTDRKLFLAILKSHRTHLHASSNTFNRFCWNDCNFRSFALCGVEHWHYATCDRWPPPTAALDGSKICLYLSVRYVLNNGLLRPNNVVYDNIFSPPIAHFGSYFMTARALISDNVSIDSSSNKGGRTRKTFLSRNYFVFCIKSVQWYIDSHTERRNFSVALAADKKSTKLSPFP